VGANRPQIAARHTFMDYDISLKAYDCPRAWFQSRVRAALAPFPRLATATLSKRIASGPRFDEALTIGLTDTGLELRAITSAGLPDHDSGPRQSYVFGSQEAVVVVEPGHQSVQVRVAASELTHAHQLLARVDALVPRRQDPPSDIVDFRFWRLTPGCGARSTRRALRCPALDDLRANYDPAVLAELEQLAGLDQPDALGKVVLWHGPPGTGKTYAVRALARHWKRTLRASVEVVLDPDELFARAHYLHDVLLSGKLDEWEEASQGGPRRRPLRLVIIEDSAALFGDACRSTPGFARLLNLSDGIIGQGLRVVFLLTTNEQLTGIDPALTRPGRCLAVSEFGELPVDVARRWLDARGVQARIESPQTLSELYRLQSEEAA
jgi:hypothetical protein